MSNYSLELFHHGVKGQIHGVRNAEWYPIDAYREHLKKSGYSKEQINKITDKINLGKSDRSVRREIKKQTKIKNKNYEIQKTKKLQNLEKAKRAKDEKDKAIKSGNIDYAKTNFEKLSNEEISELLERRNAESKIQKAKYEEAKTKTTKTIDKLGNLQDASQRLMNLANNSVNIYNTIAKVSNSLGGTDLKLIGAGDQSKSSLEILRKIDQNGEVTFEKTTKSSGKNKVIEERSFKPQGNDKKKGKKKEKKAEKQKAEKQKAEKQEGENNKTSEKKKTEEKANDKNNSSVSMASILNAAIQGMNKANSVNDAYKSYNSGAKTAENLYRSNKISESEYKKIIEELKSEWGKTIGGN